MNCVNCGTPLEEGINLCPNCGKEYLICVKCGSHNDINSDLCIQCGNSFNNDIFRTVTNNRVFKLDELISKKRKPLIYAVIAACVLSVFCLVILVKTILPDKNSGLENIFYIKNAVLYRRGSNNKTIKLSDIKTPQKKYSNTGAKVKISEDGKRIFYPNNITTSYDLNYSTLGFLEETGTIDTDVNTYMINKKGTVVYYTKGSDKVLYRFDVTNLTKTEFSDMVIEYYINPEGTKLAYVYSDIIFYYSVGNESKTTVAIDAEIVYVSKDLSEIYFIKNDRLHLFKDGKKVILLTEENISNENILIYDTGEIYFTDKSSNLYYFCNNKTVKLCEEIDYIIASSSVKPAIIIEKDQKI